MFKKNSKFTLIELIVAISIIALLATIIILNIKDMNKKAYIAQVLSNKHNIQTAVDMYAIDNEGKYPTLDQSLFGKPSYIDFSKLIPYYLYDLPEQKNLNWWVDYLGTVYVSQANYLDNFTIESGKISWDPPDSNFSTRVYKKTTNNKYEIIATTKLNQVTDKDISTENSYIYDVSDKDNFTTPKFDKNYGIESEKPQPPQVKIRNKVVAGGTHGLLLTEDGTVYSWGDNSFGQLGLGNNISKNTPTKIDIISGKDIKKLYAGETTSFALLNNGDVYSWGDNSSGSLGLNDTLDRNIPTKISTLSGLGVQEIILGEYHVFALLNNGDIYGWGSNIYGSLGLGHSENQLIPTKLDPFLNLTVKNIFTNGVNTIALTEKNEIFVMGGNLYSELDASHIDPILTPQKSDILSNLHLIEFYLGDANIIAKSNDGKLYGWGYNEYGTSGVGNFEVSISEPNIIQSISGDNIDKITIGNYHSIALSKNGEIYVWGRNLFGELGLGNKTNVNAPTKLTTLPVGSVAVDITTKGSHSFITLSNGDIYSMGYNENGELGVGNSLEFLTPQKIEWSK